MKFSHTHTLEKDWFLENLTPPVKCLYQNDFEEIRLSFSREAAATVHPDAREAAFLEGLWDYDLVEAFFLEPRTGRYLEINLAPNGAWWACWHRGVRLREAVQPEWKGIFTEGKMSPQGWQARITLPKSLFSDSRDLRYNITAVLNTPHQTFHSVAKLPGTEPDFHQPEFFLSQQGSLPS